MQSVYTEEAKVPIDTFDKFFWQCFATFRIA